jgi:hypothetical protein
LHEYAGGYASERITNSSARARDRLTIAVKAGRSLHTYFMFRTDSTPPARLRSGTRGLPNPILGCDLDPTPPPPNAGPRWLEHYCTQPEYVGRGVALFTDGSYSKDEQGSARSGSAIILCKREDAEDPSYNFHPGSCVVVHATAPLSGANYSSETTGILTGLRIVPVQVPVLVVSDALSALQAIWRPLTADMKALRQGARPQVIPAQTLLRIRREAGADSSYVHVESHTGLSDTLSRGNELADIEADKAARTLPECRPLLTFDAKCTLWREVNSHLQHIGGDLPVPH